MHRLACPCCRIFFFSPGCLQWIFFLLYTSIVSLFSFFNPLSIYMVMKKNIGVSQSYCTDLSLFYILYLTCVILCDTLVTEASPPPRQVSRASQHNRWEAPVFQPSTHSTASPASASPYLPLTPSGPSRLPQVSVNCFYYFFINLS